MQTPVTEISNTAYPDRIYHFRTACRNYRNNQFWLKQIEQQPGSKKEGSYQRYRILKRNVASVEQTLYQVEEAFGKEASDMLMEAYVDGITQKELAQKHHLSCSSFQYHAAKWMRYIIKEEESI